MCTCRQVSGACQIFPLCNKLAAAAAVNNAATAVTVGTATVTADTATAVIV